MTYLRVQHVSKILRKQKVLNDICLEMDKGKIYGLIGRNGSGKSVLMKSICGLLIPDEGDIWINGKKIGRDIDFPENTGALIEQCSFIPYLSGEKNLEMLAQINKKIDKQEIKKTMQMLGLDPENKKWVCRYSLGMKQRLALAQAFMEKYPNDMKVYYESEDFICYVMPQNMYHQYNFAIDYGYNQVQTQEEKN